MHGLKVDLGRKWAVRPQRILTAEQTESVLARLNETPAFPAQPLRVQFEHAMPNSPALVRSAERFADGIIGRVYRILNARIAPQCL